MRDPSAHFLSIRSRAGAGSIIIDTSASLSLGVLKGLEDFNAAIKPILKMVDGLVCSPGQLGKVEALEKGDAALLVRMDWNNSLRGKNFVLPASRSHQVPLLSASDARDLGAAAMVMTFLLGYEEDVEAACLKATVQLALEGRQLGLPLIVEVQPTGERVSLPGKATELGASYALEGGAEVIVVPYPGVNSLQTIGKFVSVPWLLKPASLDQMEKEWKEASPAGAAGIWLDHGLFAEADRMARLEQIYHILNTEPEKA